MLIILNSQTIFMNRIMLRIQPIGQEDFLNKCDTFNKKIPHINK